MSVSRQEKSKKRGALFCQGAEIGLNQHILLTKLHLFLLAFVALFLFHSLSYGTEFKEQKRILVLYSYHEGLPWEKLIDESFRNTLTFQSDFSIEINVEHTDRVRYADDEYRHKLIDLYRHKYSDTGMDLIIGVDDEAVDMLLDFGEEVFPEIPIVFITAERKTLQRDLLKPNMTSLLWGVDIRANVELIREILPQTRHIFIVAGTSPSDQEALKLAQASLREDTKRFAIRYLTDISANDLIKKATQLPKQSAILYLVFSRDAEGKSFVPRNILSILSKQVNVPVFGIIDTYLGYGIVGGNLLSAEVEGKRCAETALRILRGESPVDMIPQRTLNHLIFDWRELKRWGISEDKLPLGSVVRFKTYSLWELYRGYIVAALFLILVQSGLISFLLWQRAQRRWAEVKYRTVADFTYDWEYWAKFDDSLEYVSPSCERISGYRLRDFIDNPPLIKEIVVPEDRDLWDRHYHDSRQELKPREIQFRIQRRDGQIRWIEHNCQPVTDHQGRLQGFRVSNRDITSRKHGEINLRMAYTEIEQLKNQLEAETAYLQEEIKLAHNFESIVGNSAALKYVLYKAEQVASADTTVLVLGETGTGKELVARAIHNNSPRRVRPLVKVNCTTLPSHLIESELFGHERGAFTGANTRQLGRFEVADGTSIFLDEIGELPLDLQTKLLRVLDHGEFERLGSSSTIKVDVRVIAATNRDLEKEVRKGRFRRDLFYRLNVFPITVPPLRQRVEDISLLARFFVEKASRRLGKSIEQIPESVVRKLQDYSWPGNVRELENVIERAVINSSGPKLRLADDLAGPAIHQMPPPLKSLQETEKDHILRVLQSTNWRIDGAKGAALILDMNPSTLRSRMRKLRIQKR
jgi:PAS domain S-box-containing protein